MFTVLQKHQLRFGVGIICTVMVLCLGGIALSNADQAGKSSPGVTYSNQYFKGTKEEQDAQIKRIT